MKQKKVLFALLFIVFSYIMFGFVEKYQTGNILIDLNFKVKSNVVGDYQLFYLTGSGEEWSEEKSFHTTYTHVQEWQTMDFTVPKETIELRIDFGTKASNIELEDFALIGNSKVDVKMNELVYKENQISTISKSGESLIFQTKNTDPFITFSARSLIDEAMKGTSTVKLILSIALSCLLSLLMTWVILSAKNIVHFLKIILFGRKMIINLAKNDFKTKYASSYLGITWGFIQPLITIATYWFVFQVGLRSGNVSDTPFILWLLVAIVPWFFFSEAFSSATNVFSEYSYLVKKVVFKIELLPMVKTTSAFFVHIFFLLFIFVIYSIYGYYPSLFNLQVIYYVICSVALVTSISILTSALVLFFKDLNQIIIIILQVGFWFTPIGWSYTMLPTSWAFVFKLNPMFYIVEGFRDSFISHIAFYNHPYQTFYFWLFCFVLLVIGIKTFEKLKPHFADVI
ncbi:ABC transporter permease [Paenibacillus sp. sgz5001063]|uniref:ABC transporter permease n=1 Tax=Paenibacillus sp. sgz5001063 TaxID=3242474 RepID=UPI0036D2EFB8